MDELLQQSYGAWSNVLGNGGAFSQLVEVINIPVGTTTILDRYLPVIVLMRDGGLSWSEIGKALANHGGNSCTAYKPTISKRAVATAVQTKPRHEPKRPGVTPGPFLIGANYE